MEVTEERGALDPSAAELLGGWEMEEVGGVAMVLCAQTARGHGMPWLLTHGRGGWQPGGAAVYEGGGLD